jgi:uncharacterized protein YggU (UPF0235/DUF167 family)
MAQVRIRLSPRAKRTELVGRYGAGWKARVAPPPERGKANAALEELLASLLDVPRTRVRVTAGYTARDKVAEVDGLDSAEIEARLERALSR